MDEQVVGPAVVEHEGQSYTIPEGYRHTNIGRCRSCSDPVAWCLTRRDKRMPLNPDGVSHFATCPAANSWRKK